ncbi:MAG: argininosuccinate lyase [Candidatus Micrarchaeota archaeon]
MVERAVKKMVNQKLWSIGGGRELDAAAEEFTVGNERELDAKLVKYDCIASIAHAKMLKKIGLLDGRECSALVAALRKIIGLDAAGKFAVSKGDEDCHTAIENFLVAELGETGKKIHAARSRNDQVLTALRLCYKDEVGEVLSLVSGLSEALSDFKRKHGKTPIPGYTHMRKAMPSSVALWAQAFLDALEDDESLLSAAAVLADQCPLGSGAGYGLPLPVDRKLTARLLGFSKVQENPVYVQNSRGKFESSLVHALTQITFDLNKLATDAVLFSMPELGFFELPPDLCTGSSIMPHKRNPDVLELLRAKHWVVVACEFEIKAIASSLPSGYNRDLQLTKEPVFKAFAITKSCLRVAAAVVSKLGVNVKRCEAAMTSELLSAERALELAAQGVPFRDAHREISWEFDLSGRGKA